MMHSLPRSRRSCGPSIPTGRLATARSRPRSATWIRSSRAPSAGRSRSRIDRLLTGATESHLPLKNIGTLQLDDDLVARHRAAAVDARDHGRIGQLDAGAALVEIGDDRMEATAFAALEHHGFGKAEHGSRDLRRTAV